MSEFLVTDVTDGVGRITLNRPKAINALDATMMHAMYETLSAWRNDDAVISVEIAGNGDRGFCAGADVRALAAQIQAGEPWLQFLETEYALDMLIASYPKPVTTFLHGITMGGGLGIGAQGDRRVVYPDTVMAMPETKIGFFPDAGIMYFLARAGAVGRHVALTSATFTGGDALLMNLADESAEGVLPAPLFEPEATWIEECYESNDPVEIIKALESHASPAAQETARELRQRSPFAVHVALRALIRAQRLTLSEVLNQDLRLAESMLDSGDFVEGVRALLVDKDNQPKWRHASIEDVPKSEVDTLFDYGATWHR